MKITDYELAIVRHDLRPLLHKWVLGSGRYADLDAFNGTLWTCVLALQMEIPWMDLDEEDSERVVRMLLGEVDPMTQRFLPGTVGYYSQNQFDALIYYTGDE